MPDPEIDREFIKQFEQFLLQIEAIVQSYPPELQDALRDEARVALRMQLQERWEAFSRSTDVNRE